jgi:hypothetical protein
VRAVVQADAEHLPRRWRRRAEGVRRVRLGVGQRRGGGPADEPGPPLAEVGGARTEPATAGFVDVDGSGPDDEARALADGGDATWARGRGWGLGLGRL